MIKLTGEGRPTPHTPGEVGQFYQDLTTGDIYECRVSSEYSKLHGAPVGGYQWELRATGEDIEDFDELYNYFVNGDRELILRTESGKKLSYSCSEYGDLVIKNVESGDPVMDHTSIIFSVSRTDGSVSCSRPFDDVFSQISANTRSGLYTTLIIQNVDTSTMTINVNTYYCTSIELCRSLTGTSDPYLIFDFKKTDGNIIRYRFNPDETVTEVTE